jgi:hypothetical protein
MLNVDPDYLLRTLRHVAGAQHALHELVERLRTPEVEDQLERERTAKAYESTAGVLRRRSEKVRESIAAGASAGPYGEDPDDLDRRATWYEARAGVKRRNEIMPPELRTELEKLTIVGRFREELALVLTTAAEIGGEYLPAFVEALQADTQKDGTVEPWPEDVLPIGDVDKFAPELGDVGVAFTTTVTAALALLAHLGAFVPAPGEGKRGGENDAILAFRAFGMALAAPPPPAPVEETPAAGEPTLPPAQQNGAAS